ncbi:respiratory nitrate reductase subunit gamma [Litchfieldia alkalitelluris]|uniref:respiratory nitrate reductase subunit gamma n=1 Tax=Litchfieldia alkalitelluris TaxID=304268 RepID=UPI0014746584|nr:respiratory nitrate reductase subunit gamma [Litchfieldia alkalitelluris]
MNVLQSLVWVVLPYSSIAILIMGMIWQYNSSETYEKTERVFDWRLLVITAQIIIIFASGIYSYVGLQSQFNAFEWLFNLILLNPSLALLEAAPFLLKIHLLSLCSFFIILPFTKYIKLLQRLFVNKRLVAIPVFLFFLGGL